MNRNFNKLLLSHALLTLITFVSFYLITRDLAWSYLTLLNTAFWMYRDTLERPQMVLQKSTAPKK